MRFDYFYSEDTFHKRRFTSLKALYKSTRMKAYEWVKVDSYKNMYVSKAKHHIPNLTLEEGKGFIVRFNREDYMDLEYLHTIGQPFYFWSQVMATVSSQLKE